MILLILVRCLLFHLTAQLSSVFFSPFNQCSSLHSLTCVFIIGMTKETLNTELWYFSQRERSYPALLPPRPLEGRRARILQNRCCLENPWPTYSPYVPPDHPDTGMVFTQTHGPRDTTAESIPVLGNTQHKPFCTSLEDEVFKSNQVNQSGQKCQVVFDNTAYMCDVCLKRNCVCNLSESAVTKPQPSINKPALTLNETVNTQLKPFFAQRIFQAGLQEKEKDRRDLFNNRTQDYVMENNPFELKCTAPTNAEETDRCVCFEQSEKDFEAEEKIERGFCTIPSIRPRFSRGTFGSGVKRSRDLGSDLLELQDSFRKTKAHQIFHESLQDATVDLRDNHNTGRKHFFYGLNSYYFHNWKPKIWSCHKVEYMLVMAEGLLNA